MSLLAPKTPPPCKCGTKLFPKMAEEYPVDPNRLKLWESMPSVSFGADTGATPVAPSWLKEPVTFFATLGVGIAVGYVAASMGKK